MLGISCCHRGEVGLRSCKQRLSCYPTMAAHFYVVHTSYMQALKGDYHNGLSRKLHIDYDKHTNARPS
jgi:hypothetical protein